MSAEDEKDQVHGIESHHEYNFRYNRRLSCFSNAVSCIAFSTDGQYLVSGTGSGDVKVWDTSGYSEAAKLKGSRREEPRALVISPSQRWLVACYHSVLHIFQCGPPWKLEQAIPVAVDAETKELSEWCCVAFSPMSEVDHPAGHAGQDNHLAAFSASNLCVLDYSGGWGQESSRRTRSLMQSARPTSLAYTACGWWMICGFGDGQLQIWNAFSLTLEKTLSAHTASVNSLTASPRAAQYESRIVSCGTDQTLRVWHTSTWLLEQHIHELRCDRAGVRHCTFSCSGKWLVSVASEISVWRVCLTQRQKMILQLHQRLEAVCGSEGLRTAAFCAGSDAIAVGSQDGVLGLWTKCDGLPPDPANPSGSAPATQVSKGTAPEPASTAPAALPRPMQRITPQGVKPLPTPGQPRGEWFQRSHLRTMGMTPLGAKHRSVCSLSPVSAGGRLSLAAAPVNTDLSATGEEALERRRQRAATLPSFGWQAACLDDVLSQIRSQDASLSTQSAPAAVRQRPEERVSAARKNMVHACRGLVQRISLDPKVITAPPRDSTSS